MAINGSTVNDALKSEDVKSLIEFGAPDYEYSSEARDIVQALAKIDESEISEGVLAEIIRSVWSRSFGPFSDVDLDARSPAFRQIAHQVLTSSS
jgi:hypothetical protein